MVDASGRPATDRTRNQPARSGAWPQQVRVDVTRIRHQTRIARAHSASVHADALVDAIEAHLCDAEAVIGQRPWYRRAAVLDWWHGTSIEQAFRSLHAARTFLVELIPDSALDPLVPGAIARVGSCLQPADPRRLEVERLSDPHMCPRRKRAELVHALQMGYAVSDESHAHVRDFRNLLLCTTSLILLFMVLFVVQVSDHPSGVPFCFQPEITTAQAAGAANGSGVSTAGTRRTVCPSGEQAVGGAPTQPTPTDVCIVAGLGLLGGALASAVSIRKITGGMTPYDVPVALALLKVPSGALTAVAGILLLGGGFVPGLSDLDSQRQILAYALVFGYAQQLATQFLDKRAATLLAQVPSKHARTPPTKSIPQPANAVPAADATTNGHSPAYATDG